MTMLTRPILATLWPRAKPEKIDAILKVAPEVFKKYEINTPHRLAHLMAQISHECMGGQIVRENMNYSAERLMQIFGVGKHSAKITHQEAVLLAHKPREISERVYGLGNPKKAAELGNTQPGDGYRFRGNGDLQLTGRSSHSEIGQKIGYDLANNPEQLENPAISFWCAVAEFAALHCISAADQDNLELVTRRVNGGTNGLADRRTWLHKWKVAIQAETAQVEEAPAKDIDEALQADAMPRGAEVDRPKITPETGTVATTASGSAAGGIEAFIQGLQDKLGSLAGVLKSVQFLCVALAFVSLGFTFWSFWKQSQISRSR